jgi:hypothetical protein
VLQVKAFFNGARRSETLARTNDNRACRFVLLCHLYAGNDIVRGQTFRSIYFRCARRQTIT